MARKENPFKVFVTVKHGHDHVYRLRAFVGYFGEDGDVMVPVWSGYSAPEGGEPFADLEITATLERAGKADGSGYDGSVSFCRFAFRNVHHIDTVAHAKSIASVLSKLDRGMEKLRETHGYLRDSDYGAYVFRVASILGVTEVYRRETARGEAITGAKWRAVNADDLQSWVSYVAQDLANDMMSGYLH